MKRILKYILLVSLGLAILFFSQTEVKAATPKRINTMEKLKEALNGKATISGNTLTLNENVTIEDEMIININTQEIVIDFNGKELSSGMITLQSKATLKDTLGGGGMHFQKMFGGIIVEENAELIIDNGKFEDSGVYNMLIIEGKLVINNGDFISTGNNPDEIYRVMISLSRESETIINGGNFVDTDNIIKSNIGNYKLTINGGNFKGTGNFAAIELGATYPYLIAEGVESSTLPTIIFNNCNVEGKRAAVFIICGTSDKKLSSLNDKAIIFNGGTYKCTGRCICYRNSYKFTWLWTF